MMHVYSGGAIGSDFEWETAALSYHIPCHYLTFEGHVSHSKAEPLKISQIDLHKADKCLDIVNKILDRKPYPPKSQYVYNLFRRDYFTEKYGSVLYAIGYISPSQTIKGGTGWAVECAKLDQKQIFVFNLNVNRWYAFNYGKYRFEIDQDDAVQLYDRNISCVGTRQITQQGKNAIHDLFEKHKSLNA